MDLNWCSIVELKIISSHIHTPQMSHLQHTQFNYINVTQFQHKHTKWEFSNSIKNSKINPPLPPPTNPPLPPAAIPPAATTTTSTKLSFYCINCDLLGIISICILTYMISVWFGICNQSGKRERMRFIIKFPENLILRLMEDPQERNWKLREHVYATKQRTKKILEMWSFDRYNA